MEFEQIIRDIKSKNYKPIYVLCGEEEYYIDQISDCIEETVLSEGEKEFNQTILYGLETDLLTIESEAKRYPMMAPFNVVIVKEAQVFKKLDGLTNYAKNPSPTTILVLCIKHGKPDGRSSFIKEVKKSHLYFQTKKLYDNQLAPWIEGYVKQKGHKITAKANFMLIESLGSELSKIANELNKLTLNLNQGELIDERLIEDNIGISKDYNVFELNAALGELNVVKANKIIQNLGKNTKANPLPMVLPAMYRYFSQLLLYQTVKNSSDREIASKLGVNPFFVKEFRVAGRNFSTKKVARAINALRKADNYSKGIGAANLSNHQILQELVFEVIHA